MDKFDIFKSKACLLAAVLSVAGCMTIQNAWDAQEAYAPLGRDDAQIMATNRLDLSALSLSQLVDFAMRTVRRSPRLRSPSKTRDWRSSSSAPMRR